MTLVTREEWGAAAPRGDGNPLGKPKGVAIHWEGPTVGSRDHERCAGLVRGIQKFHQDTRGWSDIAYNFMVCEHGFVFEGRGARRGSAANGTTSANLDYHAICALIGEGDLSTPALFEGIREARRLCILGGVGLAVVGHKDLFGTACPGPELYAAVKAGKFAGAATPPPEPASAIPAVLTKPVKPIPAGVDRARTARLQRLLEVSADGMWGDNTDGEAMQMRAAARSHMGYPRNYPAPFKVTSVQAVINVRQDGIWGPKTQAAMAHWVKSCQSVLGVKVDGVWGGDTDSAFLKLRAANLHQF